MRIHRNLWLVASLLVLAALVAACGGGQQAAEEAEIAAPGDSLVSGNVTYLDRSALPENAVVEVDLIDASRADAPATVLAAYSTTTAGAQPPFPFELAYDPSQISPGALILVQARITVDGQLRYISQTAIPVITNGAPTSGVEVLVHRPRSGGGHRGGVAGCVVGRAGGGGHDAGQRRGATGSHSV